MARKTTVWARRVAVALLLATAAIPAGAEGPGAPAPTEASWPRVDPGADKTLPPLHAAAARGETERMRQLLAAGNFITQPDRDGWTALHWAVHAGQADAVRFLLDHGADPNASYPGLHDYAGAPTDVWSRDRQVRDYKHSAETPLCVALGRDRLDIAQTLVQHGAKVEQRRRDGRTPLMFAAHWGRPKAVQFLLDRGAQVAAVDGYGWTALHWAAKTYQSQCAELLLRRGARPNAASTKARMLFGDTHWDAWRFPKGITPLGVAVTAKDRQTPAQESQRPTREQILTVKALIVGGASPAAKDGEGRTPRDRATRDWATQELADALRPGRSPRP